MSWAFISWPTKHDVDIRNCEPDSLRLKFGDVDDIRKKCREDFEVWKEADMAEERYRMAKVQYEERVQSGLRSVESEEKTKTVYGVAWKYLG